MQNLYRKKTFSARVSRSQAFSRVWIMDIIYRHVAASTLKCPEADCPSARRFAGDNYCTIVKGSSAMYHVRKSCVVFRLCWKSIDNCMSLLTKYLSILFISVVILSILTFAEFIRPDGLTHSLHFWKSN